MIYNMNNGLMVLAVLLNNPQKLLNDRYKLTGEDFEPVLFHRIIFWAIRKLLNRGVVEIDSVSIDTFLQNYPQMYKEAEENNFLEVIENLKEMANENTFDFHYNCIKKFSLLRYYKQNGFNIGEFWDNDISFEENNENLDNYTIEKIISYFDGIVNKSKKDYLVDTNVVEYRVASGFRDIKDKFKETPLYGWATPSDYLNAITRGYVNSQLTMLSAGSSVGKSTFGIKAIVLNCCKEIYDTKTERWIKNPSYKGYGALYIQYEMDEKEEIDPKFIAYCSGVPSHKIIEGSYTEEEEKRIDKAIEILEESDIFTIVMPDYTINTIKIYTADYIIRHNIGLLVFDYVASNSEIIREMNKDAKIYNSEYQILREICTALKNIGIEYDIPVLTFSQLNGKEDDAFVVDAGCLAGARALQNKLDNGYCMTLPRPREQRLIEKWESIPTKGFKERVIPNRVIHCYKSRFSKYEKDIKIYGYMNAGNGEWIDCFCTDKFDNFIDVEKVKL